MSDTRIRAPWAPALLEGEHRFFGRMFSRVDALGLGSVKVVLFSRMFKALVIHTHIELDVFYPALPIRGDPELVAELRRIQEEQRGVSALVERVSALRLSDPNFDSLVRLLGELVERHADHAERTLFPLFDRLPLEFQEEVSEKVRWVKESFFPDPSGF